MNAARPDNEAIFHAARDISDQDSRREYVRAACGGDENRIVHVEALLAAADGPDSLLDRPAEGDPVVAADQPAAESAAERPGTSIGPYTLLEQIGEGGMGTVWMAQQQEPVKRLVAVKLVKPGMDSREVLARFKAERQALAVMDHPHIALGNSKSCVPFWNPLLEPFWNPYTLSRYPPLRSLAPKRAPTLLESDSITWQIAITNRKRVRNF
jgi:serine/threonine protein kinase